MSLLTVTLLTLQVCWILSLNSRRCILRCTCEIYLLGMRNASGVSDHHFLQSTWKQQKLYIVRAIQCRISRKKTSQNMTKWSFRLILCNTFTHFHCVTMHIVSEAEISLNIIWLNWLNINSYIKCEQTQLLSDIKSKRLFLNQNVSLYCFSTLVYSKVFPSCATFVLLAATNYPSKLQAQSGKNTYVLACVWLNVTNPSSLSACQASGGSGTSLDLHNLLLGTPFYNTGNSPISFFKPCRHNQSLPAKLHMSPLG